MSRLTPIAFEATDLDAMEAAKGRIVIIVTPEGKLDPSARRANRLTKGAVARLVASDRFSKAKSGQVISLAWPTGLAAEALDVLVLDRKISAVDARKAGAALAKLKGSKPLTVMTGGMRKAAELALGIALRDYRFDAYKSKDDDTPDESAPVTFYHTNAEDVSAAAAPLLAVAEGAHTAPVLAKAARGAGIEMPIVDAVVALLQERADVATVIDRLMTRPLKSEHG